MKKHIVLLSLMAFLVLPVFADDLVEDYFDMAKNYYRSGDYSEALEYSNTILKSSPTHFGANYLRIILTQPSGNISDLNVQKKINIRPVKVASGIKKSDEYNFKGESLYDCKDFNNAKVAFQTAIKFNLRNAYAYNNLGLTYWKLGEYRKAESAFKKANRIDTSFTSPLDNAAQMLIENKDYKLAQKYLNQAILHNKNDYCAYYLLGVLTKEQGKYQQSLKCFNQVTLLAPKFSLAYLQLADVYYFSKDYAWSNSMVEKYLECNPKDDYAYFMLYRNYFAMKDYHVAKNYIVKAAALNNCLDYRIYLAEIEKYLDNPTGTIAVLKSVKDPSPEVLNELGHSYLLLKDSTSAIDAYMSAYKKTNRPLYLYNVALVYKNIGDVTNYKKTIKSVESIIPTTYHDYIDLSLVYLGTNECSKALNIINCGIRIYPNNIELYQAKINVYSKLSDNNGILRTKKDIDRILNK